MTASSDTMENLGMKFYECPCGQLSLNISFTKTGVIKYIKPFMEFYSDKLRERNSPCERWFNATVRCITKMNPEEVEDCIRGHCCDYWWYENNRKILSCLDALGVAIVVLKKSFLEGKEVKE